MFRRYRLASAALCALAILVLGCPLPAMQCTKQLVPGVSLLQDINTDKGAEQIVNCVYVDLNAPGVSAKAAIGKDYVYGSDPLQGRESISKMTERRGALIGINADFFPFTGDPLGACVIDSELVSEPSNRVALCVMDDSTAKFDNATFDGKLTLANKVSRQIDGINRDRATNQVVLYTSTWGVSTFTKYAGTEVVLSSDQLPIRVGQDVTFTVTEVRANAKNTAVPKGGAVLSSGGPAAAFLKANLQPGDKLTVRMDIKSLGGLDWTKVRQSVGGGTWLLKNGREFIDTEAAGFGASFASARHPRTAAGVSADGKLMLVTVDGRQAISRGINLPDLSALMKRLGAVNAINLDGGGSTTLSYRGIVVNSPSGGEQRPVADGILIFSDAPANDPIPGLSITGIGREVASGQGVQLSMSSGDDTHPLAQAQLDSVVWGTTNGGGFVNQKGYLIPMHLRKEAVKAYCGSQLATCEVKIVSGVPAKVNVEAIPDKANPLVATVTTAVTDENNNPCAGKPVTLTVTGGKAEVDSGITTDKGTFTTTVTWDAAASDRSIKATSGNLSGAASPTKTPSGSVDNS